MSDASTTEQLGQVTHRRWLQADERATRILATPAGTALAAEHPSVMAMPIGGFFVNVPGPAMDGRPAQRSATSAETSPKVGDAFDTLQVFDGTVEAIDGEDVTVVLRDLSDREQPDEDAVLSIRQFDDAARVAVGAAFYLTIGYRERASGRELVTIARVRTIVPPTAAQRARALREAHALSRVLGRRGDE